MVILRPVQSPSSLPDPNDSRGLVLAAISAVGIGLSMTLARYAYDDGANGLGVTTARAIFFVPVVYLFCRLSGRIVRLTRQDWLQVVGLGLLMAGAYYGHLGAIEFVSVGVAAILFFSFPPIIGLIQTFVLREPPGMAKTLALAVSFGGLALMLGFSWGNASPLGMALALGAAFCVAWNTVWTARRLPHVDGVVVVLHMATVASIALLIACLVTGHAALPESRSGWTGLAGVVILQSVCLPLYYLALPRIGALKTGMVGNLQPVVSIVVAYLLFTEVLTVAQFLGGALVLGGIALMQRVDRSGRENNQ